jgi:isopentenyl phosphate kinase
MNQEMIFIKLGGSLITDKSKKESPRPHIITAIAHEIKDFLKEGLSVDLLIGHGSGSYGHWEAMNYNTRVGVTTQSQWFGFTRVSAAASRLNKLVVGIFLRVGVPVFSLQPSASIDADSGMILEFNTQPIRKCLEYNLIPLIYGDVAFDRTRGGTILSTEDLFAYLTPVFKPTRIILLGNAPGVFNNEGNIIPSITPHNFAEVAQWLYGSNNADVTGGMADKVQRMVDLVQLHPNLKVHICSGSKPGTLTKIIRDPSYSAGTLISYSLR